MKPWKRPLSGLSSGCAIVCVIGYVLFRLLFTASADGVITSISWHDKYRKDRDVKYSYEVDGKSYSGVAKRFSLKDYNLSTGTEVKVNRMRFLHSWSALDESSLPRSRKGTFRYKATSFIFEWGLAAIVALLGLIFGIGAKKKK